MCRSKKTLQRLEEEEDVILGIITAVNSRKRAKSRGTASVNSLELQNLWHAKILVNGQKVNFRVDTRADFTVVPRRYFTKNSLLIQKTNKKLFGPGKKNRRRWSVPSDTDNRTHRNEADFVRCRQSSRATSGQTSDRGSPSARKSEHTTVSRRLWPKQCQEWVSKVVQRSWKAEINIQNHNGEPCKAIFCCNSSSIAAANETESGGRTETYGGGRCHTPHQKSDWVVRTHCGGAQVKWQSENLRRSHKTQWERSTWELPPSLYWSTSCTTLGCQSVQQTWLQQRILSNPIAWRVSGTDYIHHAIWAILFQTTSFWNQFQAWSLPQGNDSYPVRSARSYCRHRWRHHQWKKSARTRQATAISTGKNARSRHHTEWEVRLFSWYHQVPRPHHFTGGNQSGSGQGWSHHQPPKTDQHSGAASTIRNGEPHWQIRTKSGWHHQASPWSP